MVDDALRLETGQLTAPSPVPPVGDSDLPKRRRRPSGEPPPLPRHLQSTGHYWLILTVLIVVAWTVVLFYGPASVALTERDLAVLEGLSSLRTTWLTQIALWVEKLASDPAIRVARWGLLLALLALKRFRHHFVLLGSIAVVGWVCTQVAQVMNRPRPFGIEALTAWQGPSHPSRPLAGLAVTLVGIAYTMVEPGRRRTQAKWAIAVILALVAAARLYLGIDHPSDVFVGIVLGVAIPLVAFRTFTPNEVFPVSYRRGRAAHLEIDPEREQAIRTALEQQLGITITEIQPFNLEGSAGSTPLKLTVAGEPSLELFGKLYASTHLRSDRWYKLGRTLLYGRLEDEGSFSTVRRLIQYEDYMLRIMRDAHLPVPRTFGFVEITPEREYLLVTELIPEPCELSDCPVDEGLIDEALSLVRRMWDGGLAHRDIKPSNIVVSYGRPYLIDLAFGQVRPSPWRQAVDLANMMLALALRSDPETVYRIALQHFTAEEIAEAFAATKGVTMPAQTRSALKRDGRGLVKRFRDLAPRRRPISIQRWSIRRAGLLFACALAALLIGSIALANARGAGLLAPVEATLSAQSAVTQTPSCRQVTGASVLTAQAVPTAAFLPCVEALPVGWTFQAMDVRSGAARMFLDSDRGGFRAVRVTLTHTCDVSGATELPGEAAGVRTFQRIDPPFDERFKGERFDVFSGGCISYSFDFSGEGRTALAEEVDGALGLLPRTEVDAEIAAADL